MILNRIVETTRLRVEKSIQQNPYEQIKRLALDMAEKERNQNGMFKFPFERALTAQDFSFICEVKKASPSKGVIVEDFSYLDIARDYERAGAAAISVLTEPDFFKGSNQYLKDIAEVVSIPVLRKDFIIDEYQIYEAKIIGASAILLIVAILDVATLKYFLELANSLGLSVIVEAHDTAEVQIAIDCGARIMGVNNRNLKDFTVNVANSIALRHLVPSNIIFVSESGLETPEDIQKLRANDIHVALIGESFMRSEDKIAMLAKLYGPVIKELRGNHLLYCRPKVKYCGFSQMKHMKPLAKVQPDYMGLIFADSRRQVTLVEGKNLITELRRQEHNLSYSEVDMPMSQVNQKGKEEVSRTCEQGRTVKTVGVFVNETISNIVQVANEVSLDIIQLHGDENEEYIQSVKEQTGKEVWKAVPIGNKKDAEFWYHSKADMLLFDVYAGKSRGGTGQTFDWTILRDYKRPYILAGGLTEFNIARAIRTAKPYGIDLSSGLETDGSKDTNKMNLIMEILRKLNIK